MSVVLGKNFTVYLGDSMNTIGCEDSCTVTVTATEVITTTKGSGRGTNREYGAYDATLTSTGVVFPYDSESAAAGASKTDVTFLHSYITQAKKVCAKYQLTDGSTTKWVIANWIVRSLTFTGAAEGAMTFDVELALDGQLYESANMHSAASYDGPSVLVYTSEATEDGFTSATLEDASEIYFIVFTPSGNPAGRIVYLYSEIQTLALATDLPVGAGTVGYHAASGTVNFEAGLLTGDSVLVSFDVA
jgi:hypothetical protein